MSGGITKIGKALTIIFVISLLTLLAELFYVLWRRRVFHRQNTTLLPQVTIQGGAGAAADNDSQGFSDHGSSSSKELFYFCFNSSQIPRLDRNSAPPITLSSTESSTDDDQMEVIDLLKLQNMYGPSRVLFTIKEEEREVDEESGDKSLCSSAEKATEKHSKRVSSEECFNYKVAEESQPEVVVVAIGDYGVNMSSEMTPFSTPCDSPLYFTPSGSPSREICSEGRKVEASCLNAEV